DAGPQGAASDLGQPGGRRVTGARTPDDDGYRRVAVPALDLGTAVDAQQIALVQHPGPGDAVDDLVVDGGAQGVLVAGHELEVGDPAATADVVLGERVELPR